MLAAAGVLASGALAVADTDPPVPAATSVTRRVVVSIPDRTLVLFVNDLVVSVYPVAVGKEKTPSPVGTFTIVNRVANPTYYKPGKIVRPGAANPVGTRWLGLNIKGYGIHGTDAPRSIGHARSQGCIRLRNRDVEQLFEQLRPGDVVELLAETTAELADALSQRRPGTNAAPAARAADRIAEPGA